LKKEKERPPFEGEEGLQKKALVHKKGKPRFSNNFKVDGGGKA